MRQGRNNNSLLAPPPPPPSQRALVISLQCDLFFHSVPGITFAYIGCRPGFKGNGLLLNSFFPVIFCRVAVLFTQMEDSLLLCRLAGYFMPGGDLSSFEARYSFCLDRAADVLDIFFSISFFLLGSVYSRISLACLVYNFSTASLVFSLSFAGFPEGYHLG